MAGLLETKLKVQELVRVGADENVIDKLIIDSGHTVEDIKNLKIDKKTGASFLDRVKIGLSPNLKSTQATLDNQFGNAIPTGQGNFAYMDNGQAKLFNPPGFDVGDIGQYVVRPAIQMGANIYGAYKGQQAGGLLGGPGKVVGGILGAGTGETIGGEMADRSFQAMGGEIDRTPKEYFADKIFDFGVGSVSEFASPLFLKALKYPFSGFTKTSKQNTLKNLDTFTKANVKPASLSMVTDNKYITSLLGDVEYILGNIPIAKTSIVNAGEKLQKDMANSLLETSNKIVNKGQLVSAINVGNIVKNGIDNSITAFKTESSRLYGNAFDEIVKKVGGDYKVAGGQFADVLSEMADPKGANIYKKITAKMVKDNPGLYTKDMIGELSEEVIGKKPSVLQSNFLIKLNEEIADKVKNGSLTFTDLRNYRTLIGNKITNKNLIDDVSTGELKRLYGALSGDLKNIADEVGGASSRLFKRADNYYQAGNKRIETVLKNVNKVDTDRMFNYLLNRSKDGSEYIRTIKKTLSVDEFALIQNRIIQKLGRMKAGKSADVDSADYTDLFSSENFLTNWNMIDSSAKDFLFSSKNYKGLRQDLDYLAQVAEKVRQSGKTFQNPSGTASSLIGQLSYASAVVGADLFGMWNVFLTGAYLTGGANLMTNPKVISWLAQGTKIAENKGVDGLVKHLGKASVIFAGENPELQGWVTDFAGAIANDKNKKDKK